MSTLIVLLSVALAGCTEPGVDKPEPPDLDEALAPYRGTDVELGDDNVAEAIMALDARLTAGGSLCGWTGLEDLLCDTGDCPLEGCEGASEVLDVLDELAAVAADGGMPDDPAVDAGAPALGGVKLVGEGYARVTRICPGGAPDPMPDPDNGRLELVVGFTDGGLDPIVWGEAVGCTVRVGEEVVVIDGAIALAVDDEPWIPSASLAPVLVADVRVRRGADVVRAALDFQVDLDAEELVIGLSLDGGGDLVFFARTDAKGFRAANGEWTCDFGGGTCSDGAGGTVSW